MKIQSVSLNLMRVSAGAFSRPTQLFWFVAAALIGPFALLTLGGRQSSNLPWFFWASTSLAISTVICIGFLRFANESQTAEAISINPEGRRLK